jgi:hypothetical protein
MADAGLFKETASVTGGLAINTDVVNAPLGAITVWLIGQTCGMYPLGAM